MLIKIYSLTSEDSFNMEKAPTLPSDRQARLASGSKDVPWYQAEPGDFSPVCRELLETYSHIEPDRVEAHVLEIVGLRDSQSLLEER